MTPAAPQDLPDAARADPWASRANVHTLALLALTLLALYVCVRMATPFLSALAWALALAVLALPLQRWLEARLRSRNVAAALSVLAAAIVVVVPVILVGASLVEQAVGGLRDLQAQLQSGEWRRLVAAHPRLGVLADWVEKQVDLPGTVTAAAGALTELAGQVVKGSVRQLVELLLTFYLLFYFLRDRARILQATTFLSPLSTLQMNRLYRHVGDTLHATMYGTLVVALVQGTLGGIMFWLLGLPAPLLWGVVMGLLAVVPVLGAFLVWVPAALLLLLGGHPWQALILAVWGAVVVGGIDNVLYPILVGNRLRMHTLLVFMSLVGGIFVFGAAGLVLGPVVLTATTVLLEAWRYPAPRPRPDSGAAPVAPLSDSPPPGG
jgi:predicted PurR-regulated permease PerM